MTGSTRRRLALVALLAAMVLWLWQCTSAFDREEQGEAIDVFGPWLDDDAEAFAAVLAEFTDRTGVEVRYTGSNDFDSDLRQRITRGAGFPDVAVIPQPGLVAELYARQLIRPLADETIDAIVENFPFEREDLAPEGTAFLMPYRTNVKSLVWYRPDVFEQYDWMVPDTLDGLHDLVGEIAASDISPWCFAIEAGTSTGWAASDWIEDLMLRRAGPDTYEQWMLGALSFTDEAVREAVAEFDELVLAPGRTVGGAQRILGERVEDAADPLFDEPPGCAMYKQANFATSWFPAGTDVGPDGDVDFFVLPGTNADPAPLLRGGDGLIQFSDREEVDRLMTFLAGPDGADAWIDRGGYISNRDTIAVDDYAEADRPFVELLQEGRTERFDASDSFLSEIRDAWLASMTTFIADTGRLNDLAGLDDLLTSVDEVRLDLIAALEAVPGDALGIDGRSDEGG